MLLGRVWPVASLDDFNTLYVILGLEPRSRHPWPCAEDLTRSENETPADPRDKPEDDAR